jgi:hypothetical protein
VEQVERIRHAVVGMRSSCSCPHVGHRIVDTVIVLAIDELVPSCYSSTTGTAIGLTPTPYRRIIPHLLVC